MKVQFFQPPPHLRPYISAYLWYYTGESSQFSCFKFVPSGSTYLVFNLGDPFHIRNHRYPQGTRETDDLVIGQQDSFYLLSPTSVYSHFCIIFQPTGLNRLLNLPVHELLNDATSLDLVLKEPLKGIVDNYRAGNRSLGQLVQEVDAFFSGKLLQCNPGHSYVEHTIEWIREKKGLVTVTDLAGLSNTCVRNYRRRFLELTGISPKKYILITRLKGILSALEHDEPLKIDWNDIIYNGGYFDQMHFIKEFKRFCGETPTAYLKKYSGSHHSLERYLLSLVD